MRVLIETRRLRLRPCGVEDLPALHALWADEGVRRFLFDGRAVSREEARSFVSESEENFRRRGYGLWLAFEHDGDLAGFAGFLCAEGPTPNLIYGVRPDLWGKGYATEAAGAVVDYAFEKLCLTAVRADVDEPNAASVRVLEKLGMKRLRSATAEGRTLLYFERGAREERDVNDE